MNTDSNIAATIQDVRSADKRHNDRKRGTGAYGRFDDMATVTASDKHPTIQAGTEYKVHAAHLPFLSERGYIQTSSLAS